MFVCNNTTLKKQKKKVSITNKSGHGVGTPRDKERSADSIKKYYGIK